MLLPPPPPPPLASICTTVMMIFFTLSVSVPCHGDLSLACYVTMSHQTHADRHINISEPSYLSPWNAWQVTVALLAGNILVGASRANLRTPVFSPLHPTSFLFIFLYSRFVDVFFGGFLTHHDLSKVFIFPLLSFFSVGGGGGGGGVCYFNYWVTTNKTCASFYVNR